MSSTLHFGGKVNGFTIWNPNRTQDVDTGSPHWYISYNNHDVATYGCDTTAVVLGQMECFLILNGDHRKNLKEVIDSQGGRIRLFKCLSYVKDNADKLNKFSDPLF